MVIFIFLDSNSMPDFNIACLSLNKYHISDNEAAVHSNTDSKTSDGPLVPSSTASTNPTTKPESTPNPALTSSEGIAV